MEKIVCCMDCGYCEVDSWDAWCNKENAQLNDVCDEHKCDFFFPRIEKEASFQQLSKALCGKENATLDEMLEAAEQLKHRAEPEMRPLTLEEVLELVKDEDSIVYIESRRFGGCGWYQPCAIIFDSLAEGQKNEIHFYEPGNDITEFWLEAGYGKSWRCWFRKPTREQTVAWKWEE